MLMKVHSYLDFNGKASSKHQKLQKQRSVLQDLLTASGGKAACIAAATPIALQSVQSPTSPKGATSTGLPEPQTKSAETPAGGGLRRRRSRCLSAEDAEKVIASKAASNPTDSTPISEFELHILCFSPNTKIAEIANDATDLTNDLTAQPKTPTVTSPNPSANKELLRYPDNLTYANFIDYLIVPSLVYELDYPRTQEIRPLYLLEKTLATFGTFSLLYIITEHYILPITNARADYSFFELALELTTPFMVNYVLIFYISASLKPLNHPRADCVFSL